MHHVYVRESDTRIFPTCDNATVYALFKPDVHIHWFVFAFA